MRSGFPVHRWRAAALRLALVCLLLACRPGGVRTDNGVTAKDPAGPIWDKGAAYRFDLHATALVDLGESWTAIHYELNSDLTISVVEERDGRTTLHLRLVEPKVRGLAPVESRRRTGCRATCGRVTRSRSWLRARWWRLAFARARPILW